MKIDNSKQLQLLDNLSKPSSIKAKAETSQVVKQSAVGKTDKVELSGWKDEVARLKEKVKALPDVREDKVAAAQEALKGETYNVKGELVAKSILKSTCLTRLYDMKKNVLLELEQRELSALDEFLEALKAERDAIISFSLEGIIRENNRKEEILKRLEYIEKEMASLSPVPTDEDATEVESLKSLKQQIAGRMKDVKVALEKNMGLLSFSMDHVKTSLEKILDFVNRSSYDKARSISVMVSRNV